MSTKHVFNKNFLCSAILLVMILHLNPYALASNQCSNLFYETYFNGIVPFGLFQSKFGPQLETQRLRIDISANHHFEIFERTTGNFVGTMNGGIDSNGLAHFPLKVLPKYQGLGYATEFRYAILKYLFLKAGAKNVFAQIYSDNDASLSLNKKLGFKETRRLPDRIFFNLSKEDFIALDSTVEPAVEFTLPRADLKRSKKFFLQKSNKKTQRDLRELHQELLSVRRGETNPLELEKDFTEIALILNSLNREDSKYVLDRFVLNSADILNSEEFVGFLYRSVIHFRDSRPEYALLYQTTPELMGKTVLLANAIYKALSDKARRGRYLGYEYVVQPKTSPASRE